MEQKTDQIKSWRELQGNKWLKWPTIEMLTPSGLVVDKEHGNPNSKYVEREWVRTCYDTHYVTEWLNKLATGLGGIEILKGIVDRMFLESQPVRDLNTAEIVNWIQPLADNLGTWLEIQDVCMERYISECEADTDNDDDLQFQLQGAILQYLQVSQSCTLAALLEATLHESSDEKFARALKLLRDRNVITFDRKNRVYSLVTDIPMPATTEIEYTQQQHELNQDILVAIKRNGGACSKRGITEAFSDIDFIHIDLALYQLMTTKHISFDTTHDVYRLNQELTDLAIAADQFMLEQGNENDEVATDDTTV